ncbi:MAG: tetratricopeptide repeat protein [Rhodospirillales bacterium]|nr:tetratricopeptide repeat protein [Rhodospirillales bacterium]
MTIDVGPRASACPRRGAAALLVFGALLLGASPATAQRLPAVEADRYERCMALARNDPEAARDMAERWRLEGGAHPAEHCAAVALIGLRQYADAARRLEALGNAMTKAPPALRAEVRGQAGQAWMLAGDTVRAHEMLTLALLDAPEDLDLLTDRAVAAGALGRPAEALADLDRVLAKDPGRADALTFRASAKRALGRLDEALLDAERAVKLAPKSPDALLERGNILALAGDADGARRDWEQVAKLAPASEAATAAKANLARLKRS